MKAVIPAAGFATGLLPVTKSQPKEMLPIYDKPSIQYVVEEAVDSGIDDVLIITGRGKRFIEDHFDKSYELEYALQKAGKDRVLKEVRKITDLADISYVRQKEQKGLGDAILRAQKFVGDDPFAVLLGDSINISRKPCTKQLMDVHNKYQKSIVSIQKVPKEKVDNFGIVKGNMIDNNIFKINKLVEKPIFEEFGSNLAIRGRYILTSDIFDKLKQTEVDVGGELQLTDAIQKLDEVYGMLFEGKSYSIGNRLDWIKSSIEVGLVSKEKYELIDYMKKFI